MAWVRNRVNFSPNSELEVIPGNGKFVDKARDPPKQVCRNLSEGPWAIQFLYLFWGEGLVIKTTLYAQRSWGSRVQGLRKNYEGAFFGVDKYFERLSDQNPDYERITRGPSSGSTSILKGSRIRILRPIHTRSPEALNLEPY